MTGTPRRADPAACLRRWLSCFAVPSVPLLRAPHTVWRTPACARGVCAGCLLSARRPPPWALCGPLARGLAPASASAQMPPSAFWDSARRRVCTRPITGSAGRTGHGREGPVGSGAEAGGRRRPPHVRCPGPTQPRGLPRSCPSWRSRARPAARSSAGRGWSCPATTSCKTPKSFSWRRHQVFPLDTDRRGVFCLGRRWGLAPGGSACRARSRP